MSARIMIRLKCNDCVDYSEMAAGSMKDGYDPAIDILRVRAFIKRTRGWCWVERPGKPTRDYCRRHAVIRGLI